MRPVEPTVQEGAELVIFAKDQPEYTPLPASVAPDGRVMTEWELSEEERHRVLGGGRIRLWISTFCTPLQPVMLEVTEPECGMKES